MNRTWLPHSTDQLLNPRMSLGAPAARVPAHGAIRGRPARTLFALLAGGALLTLLTGCPGNIDDSGAGGADPDGPGQVVPDGDKLPQTAQLRRFTSGDELLGYLKAQIPVYDPQPIDFFDFFGGGGRGMPEPLPAIGVAGAIPATSDSTGGAGQGGDRGVTDFAAEGGDGSVFSTTNQQEDGVDEADVFKSDGRHFYLARGNSLRIIRAVPATDLVELGRLVIGERIHAFYFDGDRLIVLATKDDQGDGMFYRTLIWPPYVPNAGLVVYAVDVSDRTAPRVTGRVELDGGLVSSRLVNGRLFLVLAISPKVPELPTRENVERLSLEEIMPKIASNGGTSYLVPVENWYQPPLPSGYSMTALVTLAADNIENVLGSVAVLAGATTIYATTNTVYVTQPFDLPNFNWNPQTAIHKFAIDAGGVPRYLASGEVPGHLLNQFSLSEHDGVLRVATHVFEFPGDNRQNISNVGGGTAFTGAAGSSSSGGAPVATDPDMPVSSDVVRTGDDAMISPPITIDIAPFVPPVSNAVFTLAENGEKLEILGRVTGIARGESLHAARFLGTRGYLVTFKKVDPLFVLDLSDPRAPRLLGELKVPGFSDYLHPLDDTHLIGVGKFSVPSESGDFDWFQGVQVSLFDVSDPLRPRAIEQLELGGRGSEAEALRTHMGFTFLPQRNLLALPLVLTTRAAAPWEFGRVNFDGVVVWSVDKTSGFTELARVSNVAPLASDGFMFGFAGEWRRAALIDDSVYAAMADGVNAASLATATPADSLLLESIAGETVLRPWDVPVVFSR